MRLEIRHHFSQQNNQQNRLSHATVLRETFRFFNPYSQLPNSEGVFAPNTRINRPQDNRLQDTDHWSWALLKQPFTGHDHWSRALLNQPSTGHRSLIKSHLSTLDDRSTYRPMDTITLRYHLSTYTNTNKFIIIDNNNYLIIQSSTTHSIPSNNKPSLLAAAALSFLTARVPSLLSFLTAFAKHNFTHCKYNITAKIHNGDLYSTVVQTTTERNSRHNLMSLPQVRWQDEYGNLTTITRWIN